MPKTLIILIGLKGSGKTYIGSVFEKYSDAIFIRAEPIWLSLKEREDAWHRVEQAIHTAFESTDTVLVESLGGSDGFNRLCSNMKIRYAVHFVRIIADPNTCLDRVHNRSSEDHIPVSDDEVVAFNRLAASVDLKWSAEIINDPMASEDTIVRALSRIQPNSAKDKSDCQV